MHSTASVEELEHRVGAVLARRPVVGIAVGVVRDGRLEFFYGHGVADLASRRPITADTGFRIASITKTFTAVAVMQLWEQGRVDLDAPANRYLGAYRLVPATAAFRPATVRHLLTHSAGLPEVAHLSGLFRPDFGESYPAGTAMPSLAEFYRPHLGVYGEPGSRFVYNNHGPATLGQLVEDVSGMPLGAYFREHILEPLGMADSDLVRSDRVVSRLATGYEIRSRGVRQVAERDMVTAGAASLYSTPNDMARYVGALLGSERSDAAKILQPETVAMMFEPHYRPDPRIPGMGLGFFRKELSGEPVVRHQGTHPGFHSELALTPARGVGVIAFTNGAHQADFWLPAAVSGWLRQWLGMPAVPAGGEIPHRPDLWKGLCGWYRLSARWSDVRLRGLMGAGAEVFVRGGRLMFRFLTPIPALAAGFPLEPDDPNDPDVFRIALPGEGLDPIRIVFGRDPTGETTRLCLDVMPLALDKRPAATNPRRWAMGVLGSAAGVALFGRRLGARSVR